MQKYRLWYADPYLNQIKKKKEMRLKTSFELKYKCWEAGLPPQHPTTLAAPPRMSSADSGPALPVHLLPTLPVPELWP